MSSTSLAPPSNWTQLPAELPSLIVSYLQLRDVLRLALINRRLLQLVRESASTSSSYNSVWSRFPPLTFEVDERIVKVNVEQRYLLVNGQRFGGKHRDIDFALSLLSALRHIPALHLNFSKYGAVPCYDADNDETPTALFSSLSRFTQRRSLEVGGIQDVAADALAVALDSLPLLTSLELAAYQTGKNQANGLTATLHRLCSTQLDYLLLHSRQLYFLINHQPHFAMPRLHSLTIPPSPPHLERTSLPATPVISTFDGRATTRSGSI